MRKNKSDDKRILIAIVIAMLGGIILGGAASYGLGFGEGYAIATNKQLVSASTAVCEPPAMIYVAPACEPCHDKQLHTFMIDCQRGKTVLWVDYEKEIDLNETAAAIKWLYLTPNDAIDKLAEIDARITLSQNGADYLYAYQPVSGAICPECGTPV